MSQLSSKAVPILPHAESLQGASPVQQIEYAQKMIKQFSSQNLAKALSFAQMGIRLAEAIERNDLLSNLHSDIGSLYSMQGDSTQALFHLKKALALYETHYPKQQLVKILHSIGGVYCRQNKCKLALKYLFQALEHADEVYTIYTKHSIATTYTLLEDYEKALASFEQIKVATQERKMTYLLGNTLINMGACYQSLKQLNLAFQYYQDALVITQKQKHAMQTCVALGSIGEIFKQWKAYDQAIHYYQQMADIAVTKKLDTQLADSYVNTADLLVLKQDHLAAKRYYQQALDIYENQKDTYKQGVCLKGLVICYEYLVEKEELIKVLKKLLDVKEQHYKQEQDQQINEIVQEKEERINILTQQQQKLTQQNKELMQYAYVIAHDLKEPLRSISGFTHLLINATKNNANASATNEYAHFIQLGVQQMNTKLNGLLKYSSILLPASSIPIQHTNRILAHVLHDDDIVQQITTKQTELIIEDLPPLCIHSKHLLEIFYQLIDNALKFNDKQEKGRIHIFHKANTPLNMDTIYIVDNGIGIDEAYQKKIFNIFHRLDKVNYEGTGIGLAVCKKIVSLYGGNIQVKSELAKGSTFSFSLARK